MADWLSAAASLIGGGLSAAGNIWGTSKATSLSKKALKEAMAERERGRMAALEMLGPDLETSGADALQRGRMTADPSQLTPSQKIQLEDITRIGRQGLSAGGLRGAGRAGQAVLNDNTRRFMADAFDKNQARSDGAVDTIAGSGRNARAGAANIEAGVAGANAGNIINTGSDVATMQGNLPVALASSAGETLGSIASLMQTKRTPKYPVSLQYVI